MTGFTRRQILKAAVALPFLPALSSCVNLATGSRGTAALFSLEEDVRVATMSHHDNLVAGGGELEDRRAREYIESLGQKLVPHVEYQEFPYTFTVTNSLVVNAYAMPGGYTYYPRGMVVFCSSEAELVSIMAHELGHVNARHGVGNLAKHQISSFAGFMANLVLSRNFNKNSESKMLADMPWTDMQQAAEKVSGLYSLAYSTAQEYEADRLGIRYSNKAGYDAAAMLRLYESLYRRNKFSCKLYGISDEHVDEYSFFASHPRTPERLEAARVELNQVEPATKGKVVGRDRYLSMIDGLHYLPDPELGMWYRDYYVNTKLGLRFEIPEDFSWSDLPTERIAARYERDEWGQDVRVEEIRVGRIDRRIKKGNGDAVRLTTAHSFLFEYAPSVTGGGYIWTEKDLKIPGCSSAASVEKFSVMEIEDLFVFPGITNRDQKQIKIVVIPEGTHFALIICYTTSDMDISLKSEKVQALIRSITRLSEAEKKKYRPLKIRKHKAGAGDTVASLSRYFPFKTRELNEDYFRIFNGMPEGAEVRPGDLLKVLKFG